MANTTTSNTTGLLGLAGQAMGTPTYYNQLAAAQQSQLYQYPMQYTTYATQSASPMPPPAEKEITVPVIEVTDYRGVFLRDKTGSLMHVSAERLYKALGLEW